MLAVEISDLTKDYLLGFWRKRPRRALDQVNLQVEAGQVFGLLGPNGAGKTTTLKVLFRLVFPTSGTARILGKELDDISLRSRVGYLPENPYFYDHLTAGEFLNYAAALFGLSASERRLRTSQWLERLSLQDTVGLPLRKFSKGMTQRLGIAQALINDPEIIFLDEPMSGLDPVGRREVRDLILELKRAGKTIFFSTHILSDAETLCDQVAILNRGRLQGCGELGKILGMSVAATEMVLEEPSAELLRQLESFGCARVRTGDLVRVEIPPEAEVAAVLKVAVQGGVKIVSLNPVKMSLEDYFLSQVAPDPEPAGNGRAPLSSG